VSDRERPVFTGVNGTLMARPSWPDSHRSPVACSSPILLDRCHPSGRGRCVKAREATAQRLGLDSVDSAEIIVQRGGRAPAWKVGNPE